jgi:hypothetical protein
VTLLISSSRYPAAILERYSRRNQGVQIQKEEGGVNKQKSRFTGEQYIGFLIGYGKRRSKKRDAPVENTSVLTRLPKRTAPEHLSWHPTVYNQNNRTIPRRRSPGKGPTTGNTRAAGLRRSPTSAWESAGKNAWSPLTSQQHSTNTNNIYR